MKTRNYLNNPKQTPFIKQKNYIIIFLLFFNYIAYTQVGINNIAPKAALDISASSTSSPVSTDGILIPRMDEYPSSPGANQNGMLIYITGDSTPSEGFYWYDHSSTSWMPFVRKIDDLTDGKSDVYNASLPDEGPSLFLGDGAGVNDNGSTNMNVGIGYHSLNSVTWGNKNIAIGINALESTTGSNNIGIGLNTLKSITNKYGMIAIGSQALSANTTGGDNLAIGINALMTNTTGVGNIAIGGNTLDLNTGSNNTAIGINTLTNITQGNGNTAIGGYALNLYGGDPDHNGNTAIGNHALANLSTGEGNTAIGFESLEFGTKYEDNTAIGHFSGFHAGRDGTQVDGNTFIGKSAGFASTGDNNVFIGHQAGGYGRGIAQVSPPLPIDYATGSNNVFIGHQAGYNITVDDLSDKLIIENSAGTNPLIYGEFDNNRVAINWDVTSAPTNTFSVNGTASNSAGGNWLINSDRRLKNNIETIPPNYALNKITNLRGVSFNWNDTQTGLKRPKTKQFGFIAQELMEVFPQRVNKDNMGFLQTAYGDYDALFVQAFKELKSQLSDKDQRINELESQVIDLLYLSERLDALEAKLDTNKDVIPIDDSE